MISTQGPISGQLRELRRVEAVHTRKIMNLRADLEDLQVKYNKMMENHDSYAVRSLSDELNESKKVVESQKQVLEKMAREIHELREKLKKVSSAVMNLSALVK